MALPPWLDINPSQFLAAMEAGTRAGQAASLAAQRRWEQEQQLLLEQKRLEAQQAHQKALLDATTAYRLNQLGLGKERIAAAQASEEERQRHNQAIEDLYSQRESRISDKPDAEVVSLPEVPGVKFIKQPSGTLLPIERPAKPMTEGERLSSAIRLQNMMGRKAGELYSSPAYQSRTNFAAQALRNLSAPIPQTPQEVIRMDKKGRQVVYDAATKKALRYADEPADMGGNDTSGPEESDDE
jgi:hypothetical protein